MIRRLAAGAAVTGKFIKISTLQGVREYHGSTVVTRPALVCEAAVAQSGAMPNEPNRLENRTPLRVAVDLASLEVRYPAQQGVTENVSLHGARVVTGKPWPLNERLNIRSLVGNLRSRARVVYCEARSSGDFVLGLQLSATAGDWTVPQRRRRGIQ